MTKQNNKSNKQTKALIQNRIPLRLAYFIYLLSLVRKGITHSWLFKGVKYLMFNTVENYPTLYRYARLIKGLTLQEIKSLDLFTTSDSPEESEDESEKETVTRDYNIWYPFKPMPNVRTFKVQLSGFDWMYAMFGIRKRMKPIMESQPFENDRFNRYMECQLRRLEDARVGKEIVVRVSDGTSITSEEITEAAKLGIILHKTVRIPPNPKLYFRICESLIKHSLVFFVWQLSQTDPLWHRNKPLWKIEKWYKEYAKQVRNLTARLYYHRTFIPKANGKQRPLGVPSIPWRIQLGLWNKFLLKFLRGKISVYQHAYQPYKGTLSAWRQISKYVNYRNIYSVDLKGYFDKVSLRACIKALQTKGIPKEYCNWFYYLHLSLPINITKSEFEPLKFSRQQQIDILKEMGMTVKQAYEENKVIEKKGHKLSSWDTFKELWKYLHLLDMYYPVKGFRNLLRFKEMLPHKWKWNYGMLLRASGVAFYDEADVELRKNFDEILGLGFEHFAEKSIALQTMYPLPFEKIGVPQGAPISPLIAIMALEETVIKNNTSSEKGKETRVVGYSDDWLFFTNDDDRVPHFEFLKSGIIESKEKSHWVKSENKWKCNLDFLGLSYDGLSDTLRANTRSGSVIPYDKYGLMDLINMKELTGRSNCDRNETDKPCENCPSQTACEQVLRMKSMCDTNWSIGGSKWKEMVNHKLFGLIQSRLYQGNWNLLDFDQNFKLTYCKKSWVDGPGRKWRKIEDLNVFTSTTFASHSLIEILRVVRKGKRWITLDNGHSYPREEVIRSSKATSDKETSQEKG